MKCSRCQSLNAPGDTVCGVCHQPLVIVDTTPTPQWAYFFAVACGAIPILTLGGLIPALLGFGGASGCLTVCRMRSVPVALRLLACVGITAGCWLLFVLLMMAMVGTVAKRR
jgi:hypothetical protein